MDHHLAPVVLVIGKPGSGKSAIVEKLQAMTGYRSVDTLELRQEAILDGVLESDGFSPNLENPNAHNPQILTAKIRQRIKDLDSGQGIIIEGVWKTSERRHEIIDAARAQGRPIILVEVEANYLARVNRVLQRKLKGVGLEPSNKQSVLDEYEGNYDPTSSFLIAHVDHYLKVDTTNPLSPIIMQEGGIPGTKFIIDEFLVSYLPGHQANNSLDELPGEDGSVEIAIDTKNISSSATAMKFKMEVMRNYLESLKDKKKPIYVGMHAVCVLQGEYDFIIGTILEIQKDGNALVQFSPTNNSKPAEIPLEHLFHQSDGVDAFNLALLQEQVYRPDTPH